MFRFPVFVAALLLLFVSPAPGQITITKADAEAYLAPGLYAEQNLTAAAGESTTIQNVLDQIGNGGVYDFSTVSVSASFSENEVETRPFSASVPVDPDFDDADYVDISGGFFGSTTYNFLDIEDSAGGAPDGLYEHGDLAPSPIFSTKTRYTPPLLAIPLPITAGTVWDSGTVTEETFVDGTLTETTEVNQSGEVIGYGTLVLPGGKSLPCLVYRLIEVTDTSSTSANRDTTRSISFITKSQVGFATVLVDADGKVIEIDTGVGSTVPAAFFGIESDQAASESFAAGETGSFLGGTLGASVEITSGSATGSTLRGYRINFGSFNNAIDDTGTPAGFPVTNVSTNGYWVIQVGAFNGTYEICLDYSGVPGITDETQLAVLRRSSSVDPWTTLASTVNTGANQVCAGGLNIFSEFAIGGSASNPLPVELANFDAVQVNGGVALEWETASETDNAGFHVERAHPNGGFERIAFLEGAGTTSHSTDYRIVDEAVPFSADVLRYRLRQVDMDGSTWVSNDVVVRMGAPQRRVLYKPSPNPVRGQATLRYALPEPANVEISVYNTLGQRLSILANGRQPAGRQERIVDASRLPSGLYFVRMMADGELVNTRRLTVVR